MSGSAGGNRILREDVEDTVDNYYYDILSSYLYYEGHAITGSYNCSNKRDFGDIDLIIQVSPSSTKKDFAEYIKQFPNDTIIPFRSTKYEGKKYLNSGEIVTILYPIQDCKGVVQIDNIISFSMDETIFKNKFLSLPAIKQGLVLGLAKVTLLEKPWIVPYSMDLAKGQELEFNLSSSGLTLRLVDITPDFKITLKKDIWHTQNWNEVESLILKDYNFNDSFEEILTQIKKTIKHPRSINRIKGIFKSMVSVKSGEVDTEKGREKENSLNLISKL